MLYNSGAFSALPDNFDLKFLRDTEHIQGFTITTQNGNDFVLEAEVWPSDEINVFESGKSNYDILIMKQLNKN